MDPRDLQKEKEKAPSLALETEALELPGSCCKFATCSRF